MDHVRIDPKFRRKPRPKRAGWAAREVFKFLLEVSAEFDLHGRFSESMRDTAWLADEWANGDATELHMCRTLLQGGLPKLISVGLLHEDGAELVITDWDEFYKPSKTAAERQASFRGRAAQDGVPSDDAPDRDLNGNSVYFIQCETSKRIKIGFTNNVGMRLFDLQRGSVSKLSLIGTLAGGSQTEKGLHKRFKAARKEGEWFEPVGDLVGFVAALRNGSNERNATEQHNTTQHNTTPNEERAPPAVDPVAAPGGLTVPAVLAGAQPERRAVARVERPEKPTEDWDAMDFWRWTQDRRQASGYLPERMPNPRKLSGWWSEARAVVAEVRRLKAGFYRYGDDEYWKAADPPYPFHGFMSQWERFVPPAEDSNAA